MSTTRITTIGVLALTLLGPCAAGAADAPPGAMSCSGCNPAARGVDASVPRLVGRDPADIVTAMQGFKSGQRPSTVMDRISKGFSDDEVKAIADWYGTQKD